MKLPKLETINTALVAVGLVIGAFGLGHEYGESKGKEAAWQKYQQSLYTMWPTAGTISITQKPGDDPCLWFYTGKDWWSPMERCEGKEQPE